MKKDSKIWVAGSKGLVGSAILRKLQKEGFTNLIVNDRTTLDLVSQDQVKDFFQAEMPEYVFLAAAKVGGIKANTLYKGEFIYNNLMIETNIIHYSYEYNVKKLLFLGSNCIYPKVCSQPIKEEYLLSGYLEETNDAYAIAKIAGIKMCQSYNQQYGTNFISGMPCNMYGINDNYHKENSHVFASIVRKLHEAKINGDKNIYLWGDGTPYREFLHADDLADACYFLMCKDNTPDLVNIGSGKDYTISEIAHIMRDVIYPECQISFDGNKDMNGTHKKLLDNSILESLGWRYKIELKECIKISYEDFLTKSMSI